jgi:putative heme-binding domain-containing protein
MVLRDGRFNSVRWKVRHTVLAAVAWLAAFHLAAADEPDCFAPDPELKVVRIDSDPRESFLGIALDSFGRMFVGGREALFVYEPDRTSPTGYGPRQELYRFPDHTWVYDIAVRGNDLYVLTVSALYVVPDAVTKRAGLLPKRLVWGVPLGHVHQCFHGMAIGPEGDIYFAMGDPLWYYGDFNRPDHWGHWTFFFGPDQHEGRTTWQQVPYNGVGGVFRCRPDGSGFQVVARGLRNPCGLCFDEHFNLFTNDNDHEGLPAGYVPGRLLHVTPHAYFSWPRGWMVSKTPDRADLLDDLYDKLGRAVPVGQAYYHETYLPEKYCHNLLVARWGIRAVTCYPLVPQGASFKAASEEVLLQGKNNARPVHVAVGRGGRVFVSIAYMAHNEGSPVYPSDLVMITRQADKPPYEFPAYEHLTAPAEKLVEELARPSWHERYRAHVELKRRGEQVAEVLRRAARPEIQQPVADARQRHRVWLAPEILWQAGQGPSDQQLLLQVCRRSLLTGKTPTGGGTEFYRAMLANADLHLQLKHAALLGLFQSGGEEAPGQALDLEAVAQAAATSDRYLRQAGAFLLAERASLTDLSGCMQSADVPRRLLGVLAAGFRLTIPPAHARMPAELKLEEPRGPVLEFLDGTVDLRKLGPIGNYTIAEYWQATKHTPDQERLFALLLAALDDPDEVVRLQAAHFLYLLNDPRSEPRVEKVRRASDEARLNVAAIKHVNQVWLCGPFDDAGEGFQRVHPPERGPVDIAGQYHVPGRILRWQMAQHERLFDFRQMFGRCDGQSFYATFQLDSAAGQRIHLLVGSDDGIKVWHNGREVFARDVARGALPFQDVVSLVVEAGRNDLLIRVRNHEGTCGLYVHCRALAEVTPRLPEKLGLETLAQRLRSAGGPVKYGAEFEIDWGTAVARDGNPEKGRKLFEALACAKCHAVTSSAASAGGPSLAEAGRRFTVPDLVQSILLPSKQVSPVFRASVISTRDGLQYMGLVIGETGEKLELLLPEGKQQTLDKRAIQQRELLDKSPMPEGIIKEPSELRDVLAYLMSLGVK